MALGSYDIVLGAIMREAERGRAGECATLGSRVAADGQIGI